MKERFFSAHVDCATDDQMLGVAADNVASLCQIRITTPTTTGSELHKCWLRADAVLEFAEQLIHAARTMTPED